MVVLLEADKGIRNVSIYHFDNAQVDEHTWRSE